MIYILHPAFGFHRAEVGNRIVTRCHWSNCALIESWRVIWIPKAKRSSMGLGFKDKKRKVRCQRLCCILSKLGTRASCKIYKLVLLVYLEVYNCQKLFFPFLDRKILYLNPIKNVCIYVLYCFPSSLFSGFILLTFVSNFRTPWF